MFDKLLDMVQSYPHSYHRMLCKTGYSKNSHGKTIYNPIYDRRDIFNWITEHTPKLNNPFYSISTKCYWILNGLTDFPHCKHCNKQDSFINKNVGIEGYKNYCSAKCMANSDFVVNKKKETCRKKYGSDYMMGSDYYMTKSRETKLRKYGHEYYFDKEKSKQTRINKYGGWESDETTKHRKETNLKKYGVENPFASKEIQEKIKKTNLEKYGVEYNQQNQEIRKRSIETRRKKYGKLTIAFKYEYDNRLFDSSWELAYYIWLQDNNIKFEYQPNISFKYVDGYGKSHEYYPDFLIDGKYIEIKGDQFMDEKTGLFCEDEKFLVNGLHPKYKCMMDNNVSILPIEEINEYVKYCGKKFKNYLWYHMFKHIKQETKSK